MTMRVSYRAALPEGATGVLVPGGMATPHGSSTQVEGEGLRPVSEAATGQRAFWCAAPGATLDLAFHVSAAAHAYPEALFTPHVSPFTRAGAALVAEVRGVAPERAGLARARAIARHTADRFTYGHPETAFTDGLEEIPALGCGLTEGACVDINTYFIAALRAVGIEAGYVTGLFFPAEKRGTCEDGHCWVVTRIGGETQEWDIAHHLKLGTRDIHDGLNPKPGQRAATFHSMGLQFPEIGAFTLKALIEPLALVGGRLEKFEAPEIRLHAPEHA